MRLASGSCKICRRVGVPLSAAAAVPAGAASSVAVRAGAVKLRRGAAECRRFFLEPDVLEQWSFEEMRLEAKTKITCSSQNKGEGLSMVVLAWSRTWLLWH